MCHARHRNDAALLWEGANERARGIARAAPESSALDHIGVPLPIDG